MLSYYQLLSIISWEKSKESFLALIQSEWPFSLPYVLEIFSTCIFSDEEFESEIRF